MSSRVLVTDYSWPSLEIERAALAQVDAELIVAATGDDQELLRLAPTADAILTNWRTVSAAVIDAAQRCKVIARYGVGVDNIDVEAATRHGIAVCNVPDFCTEEVADHTIALMLALSRNIVRFAAQTSRGGWDNLEFGPMHRLRGRTLGLVGYGAIARAVADRALIFGIEVVAFSRSRRGAAADGRVRFASSLESLVADSDTISLHLPGSPETANLVDTAFLSRARPGAILINTSRGSLVDQTALTDALRQGRLGGAALDVADPEPLPADHPLRQASNVIVTPHAAFMSAESIVELQTKAARNVADALQARMPATTLNQAQLAAAGVTPRLATSDPLT